MIDATEVQGQWRGWVHWDRLAAAEEHFERMSGRALSTPVFELALGDPGKYGTRLHYWDTEERAACGISRPGRDQDHGEGVAFWSDESERVRKCKRCLNSIRRRQR